MQNFELSTDFSGSLAVAEQFYSIQGEGKTAGSPSFFLRLAGCNLMCGGDGTQNDGKLHNGATWRCDSIEVWRKGKKKTFSQIVEDFGGQQFISHLVHGAHLVITGGEPLLQKNQVAQFLHYLYDKYRNLIPFVEIETNGTIMPGKFLKSIVKQWNCSPKLKNSGMASQERIVSQVIDELAQLNEKTIFKFVVGCKNDWEEIKQTYCASSSIKRSQIWLMPSVDNAKDYPAVAQVCAEICKDNTLNFSSRSHITIWDKKTGV